jgi:hypothetical protein
MMSQDNREKRIGLIQPGLPIQHPKGMPGTLGAYGLTKDGFITLVSTGHTLTNLWKAKVGDPILVYALTDAENQGSLSEIIWTPRIRGIEEDLPVVLKSPTEPRDGMKVIKSGWRTGVTTGEIREGDWEATIEYRDGSKRKYKNLGLAQIEAEHGDSGSVLFTCEGYQPVGMIVAKHKIYSNTVYFVKFTNVTKLKGVFCPISLPQDSTGLHKEIVASLVPDGLFMQKSDLTAKKIGEVMSMLGVTIPDENNASIKAFNSPKKMKIGEMIYSYDGRIAFNKDRKIIGIVFAGSSTHSVVMPIDRILSALNLELVKYS